MNKTLLPYLALPFLAIMLCALCRADALGQGKDANAPAATASGEIRISSRMRVGRRQRGRAKNPAGRRWVSLLITTDPSHCLVAINDKLKGQTDAQGKLAIPLRPGTYQIYVSHDYYVGERSEVKITPTPVEQKAGYRLKPLLKVLRIKTDPPKTEVYLDDVYKGTSDADGLLAIEQVLLTKPHKLRASKVGYADNSISFQPDVPQVSIKLLVDPLIASGRDFRQHLSAGKLSDAFSLYQNLARTKPDFEDLPSLLNSILQGLQSRSMNMLMKMSPYGLFVSVEEAQELNRLYEQASRLRPADTTLVSFAEYWKMKSLLAQALRTSDSSERESLLRSTRAIALKIESLNAQNAYLLSDLGWVYMMLKDIPAAQKAYESAQKFDPNLAYPYFALGLINMNAAESETAKIPKSRYYQAAIDKFTQTIKVKPDFSRAYMLRCISYAVLNRHQESLADGQQAVAMRPQSAYAHFALGFAYYQKGRTEYQNSMREFDLALSLTDDALNEGTKNEIQRKLVKIKKTLGINH